MKKATTSRFWHDTLLRIVKVANLGLVSLPFMVCWILFYNKSLSPYPYGWRGLTILWAFYCALYFAFGKIYDAFQVSLHRISEMIYSQFLATFFANFMIYFVTMMMLRKLPKVLPYVGLTIVQFALETLWCLYAHRWYFSVFPPAKTLIIYDVHEGMENLINEYGLSKKFDVLESLHIEDALADDMNAIKRLPISVIFMCGVHSKERNIVLKYCVENRITMYVIPRVGDVIMSSAVKMHMFHLPMLRVDRYKPDPEFVIVKRIFDIVSSGLGLIVLFPVFLAVAIAIKLEDGGPVFYKQDRLTKDGKVFKVIKFRSMRIDAEKDGVARLSTGENDDRITKVGHVIRKFRLDELPQLINIFNGDMSVVGPRPERPEIAAAYDEVLPEFKLRLQAKAGLTGYAQVYGKYNTTPYDKLQMDLLYIANPNLIEDLKIIFATIKILFVPDSTEGIAEGQMTAMIDIKK